MQLLLTCRILTVPQGTPAPILDITNTQIQPAPPLEWILDDDDDAVAADARPVNKGREDGPLLLGPPADATGSGNRKEEKTILRERGRRNENDNQLQKRRLPHCRRGGGKEGQRQ